MATMWTNARKQILAILTLATLLSMVLGACTTPTPVVQKETVIVKETVPVTVKETVAVTVKETVSVEKLITPTAGAQTYRAYTFTGKPYAAGTTVTYMAGMSIDQQRALLEDAAWFKTATGIDLKIQIGDDAKFNALVAAGTPPDLYYCSTPGLQAADGTFAPIDQYIDKTFLDRVPKVFLDGFTGLDGKLYGLQLGGWFPVVLVNTKLIKDSGGTVPNTDMTWEDVVAIGQKVTKDKNGKAPTDAAFDAKNVDIWGYWAGWFADDTLPFSNGARRFDETGTRSLVDDPKFIEAWKWWSDLTNTYKIMPSNSYLGTMGQSAGELFLSGKMAMFSEGIDYDLFRRANEKLGAGNWKIVAYPHPKSHDLVLSRYQGGACVAAKSKNPAAAVEALKFLAAAGYPTYPNMWLKDSDVVTYWLQFYPFLKDAGYAEMMKYSLTKIGPEPWNGSAAPFNIDRYTQGWDFWEKWGQVRDGKLAFDKFDFKAYAKQANEKVVAGMEKDLTQVTLAPAWKDALTKLLATRKADLTK